MYNRNNIFLIFIIGVSILAIMTGCKASKEKKYVIGLSQCMLNDAWRQAMIKETLIEASNYDNIEILIRDAQSDNETQIRQIRELIAQKVDVLIISPFQSQPITPVAEEAYRAGIPTIITDRKVNTDLYTTFVGADNYAIGYEAGRYAAKHLTSQAVVLEIWGMTTSSPAQDRHQGFVDALRYEKRSDIHFKQVEGDWLYDTAKNQLDTFVWPFEVDFVYSHNDMMAIAAREYFVAKDSLWGRQLPIIGVDAVAGAGLEAVADGRIDASFLYPTGGEKVIRTAISILRGETVDQYIPLQTGEIDKATARTLLIQAARLQNYQERIERQRSNIESLLSRFRFLEYSLLIITSLMIGLVLLSIYTFSINRKLKKKNDELREINQKEEEQRKKLISLNAEIKEVTAQKLQFFTNISHEIRTPLTLILDPLNHLMNRMYDSPHLPTIRLMQKNATRLSRVINQMLEFRKVENEPGTLNIGLTDIVALAHEVKVYFDHAASARHITYTFVTGLSAQPVWIDPDKIEKVLVNLLSNAFKFTPEEGHITLSIHDDENHIYLKVTNDGVGIPVEKRPYLFDRFYTEGSSGGTGIGLYLVKKYVEMHNGTVAVESLPLKQTTFTVSLHKDRAQIAGYKVAEQPVIPPSYHAEQLDDTEEKTLLSGHYPYTILIVEDDDEVRHYLEDELSKNFRTRTAHHGREALGILRNPSSEISLILSDVMMPEMNGFELCRAIKTDLSIGHLPVILLTALTHDRQRLYGISGGADDYIQKPFQTDFIKLKVIRLLGERKRLHDQLLQKLQEGKLLLVEPDKTEHAENVFLRRFMAQIEEIYADPEYNVEKLSDTLGLSRGHLYRKVKELTGVTPVEFLRSYRLNQACLMLKKGTYTISEIAYRTGFSSPAYFTRCFKATYDVTPSEYTGAG